MKRTPFKHLTAQERAALAEYVDRLQSEFGDQILRVILYGSKVRGDFDAESDIDVCVVVRDLTLQRRHALIAMGVDVDLKHNVLIGDFIVDEKQFKRMAEYREPIYRDLQQEGIELWTRRPERSSSKSLSEPKMTYGSRTLSKRKAGIAKPSAERIMQSLPRRARRSSHRGSRAKGTRA